MSIEIKLCLWLPDVMGLLSSIVILEWPVLIAAVKNQESDEPALFHFISIGETFFKHFMQVFFAFGMQSSNFHASKLFLELKEEDMDLEKKSE